MNCNCKKVSCGCDEPKCACPKPTLEVVDAPESLAMLRFNVNGLSTYYDYQPMIERTQTDTTLESVVKDRVLKYMAERHTDTISAEELGAILHVANLGDVDVHKLANGSLMVYHKDTNCGQGCEGISNRWRDWNALDNQDTTGETIMAFDNEGLPHALSAPANTNQHYHLSWAAGNKVRWKQPVQFSTADNKKPLYIDLTTKEIGYLPD